MFRMAEVQYLPVVLTAVTLTFLRGGRCDEEAFSSGVIEREKGVF